MSSINPFIGYVAQGGQVERAQAADKARQVRREQALSKSVAARADELEHQVESAEAVAAIHDEGRPPSKDGRRRKREPAEDEGEEPPHVDVKA